ncbi:NLI interacting factor-like phosphatase [Nitzschia inconspicua]|uniref:Mitochondrial import inner membrane translocase subunit TIM50 n=1 Tax=Nitzschia inconspicua TaxID=303405 RepID=A0A9K3PFM3_9STRA|nr:NLI interacting factor-like phosphatase [Nitzschia inconspicua]
MLFSSSIAVPSHVIDTDAVSTIAESISGESSIDAVLDQDAAADCHDRNVASRDKRNAVLRLLPFPKHIKPAKSDLIVLMDIDLTMVKKNLFLTRKEAYEYIQQLPKGKSGMTVMYLENEFEDRYSVVNLRPGLFEFLKALSEQCEVHIFTAGMRSHAYDVAQLLDPEGNVFAKNGIWSSCDGPCVHIEPTTHWKDLSLLPLGRSGDLSRVVLIDDNEITLMANPDNVYIISEFVADSDDNELEKAWHFLAQKLIHGGDVRPILQKEFKKQVEFYRIMYPGSYRRIQEVAALKEHARRTPLLSENGSKRKSATPPTKKCFTKKVILASPKCSFKAVATKIVNKAMGNN